MKRFIVIALMISCIQVLAQEKVKIDGVATVVGDNIVLDSEIDAFKQELIQQSGGQIEISDCEMLEQIMNRKLLAHHAVIDSIVVNEGEIQQQVQRKTDYFSQQLGSQEKMLELYGFDNLKDLKDELYRVEKEGLLIQKMQQQLTADIDITPEEVKRYYISLEEEGNLPEIGAEIELSQIVLNVEPSEEAVEKTIARLKEIKKEVEDGGNFKMKAILYSDDPGVTQNSGFYSIERNSPFVKEFKETAFSLEEGEISQPFKSDFGYHIMLCEKIKGKQRDVYHILMQPKPDEDEGEKVRDSLIKYRQQILKMEVPFEEAVLRYSQDKDTRLSGGVLMNPESGDTHFDLTRMDPDLYAKVSSLKEGEISDVFLDETPQGLKMYKILLLKSRTESHTADLVQDYVKIMDLALQKKKTESIEKWSEEKIQDTYVNINDFYSKCEFKSNWSKSQ
ncbi:peptidylprolyl isomerase [Lutimonas zeaxanthinifaciens]|uniref:peptidylprolyl isomerase n=1 Tax=Lutimonas zeaxanthinifaciens TaxID=3060215 RepID=UPI00265D3566|nr:peptidylprolyl isomerase [Lutimonas sp. YSD2104]WKK67459.1 peptidylprolyl isomerase [Lutimonas sp. YSD2104]